MTLGLIFAKPVPKIVGRSQREMTASFVLAGRYLKLSGSIGEGELWKRIILNCRDKLILIVSSIQLRQCNVRLSRGLSWEATIEDILAELDGNSALEPLLQARHLIVTFGSDGAIWLDNEGAGSRKAMLVFDGALAEGDWITTQGKGAVFGYLSCFTAATVYELCKQWKDQQLDLEDALYSGLQASRELKRIGHGPVKIRQRVSNELVENPFPGFPHDELAQTIQFPTDTFVSCRLPAKVLRRGRWMMLDEWQVHAHDKQQQRPHFEAATALAVLGPAALKRFPVARFGDLLTVERQEIESLRGLRKLIRDYEDGGRQKKPLSVGIFGPPGAGKSFGIVEIAKGILGKAVPILMFNLSQFSDPADLNGALHQVRDRVLAGATPIIFWDEFDSQNYRWLQYLLAPMQDGVFQDGQLSHPIGKCIFAFAGATSATYQAFGPRDPDVMPDDEVKLLTPEQRSEIGGLWRDFVIKKGPDFKSRLAGYLNVLGPNPRQVCIEKDGGRVWRDDPTDLCFPIRRSLFIRSKFGLEDGQVLEVDPGVLRGLLEIPRFKSGARSLEFLCLYLHQNKLGIPRRSHLPGESLLNVHLDAERFWQICERDLEFAPAAARLAQGLHEDFVKGLPEDQKTGNPNAVPWDKLTPDSQSANLAQAARIPTGTRTGWLARCAWRTPRC